MDAVSEIKSRVSIEELVAKYVQLTKAGRNFKGLCPFHNEKTPSFIVSPDKQLAYCFGCHKGGDVFQFFQEVERVEFPEALRMLAEQANVELPKKVSKKYQSKKKRLLEMHDIANKFFIQELWDTDKGKKVLSYIRDARKFKDDTIRSFGLGYSPEGGSMLIKKLLKDGYTSDEIVEAGLGSKSTISGVDLKDRFQNRLMFPIWDGQGRVIGFGGRAVKKGQEPKYLNSPDTPLYNKGLVLYAFHLAKDTMRHEESAVIVEGYMDVLRCHEMGLTNAIATCGTALTAEQAKLIKRFATKIVLFFDGDRAGHEAAVRAFPIAEQKELHVKVLNPPDGDDPDTWLFRSNNEVIDELKKAPDFFAHLLKSLKKQYDVNSIEDMKKALADAMPFVNQVTNRIEQDRYIRELAHLLGTNVENIHDEMKRAKKTPKLIRKNVEELSKNDDSKEAFTTTDYLLGCLLQYPSSLVGIEDTLTEDFFTTEDKKTVYRHLKDAYNDQALDQLESGGLSDLLEAIPEELRERANILALYAESQNSTLSQDEVCDEVKKVVLSLQGRKRDSRQHQVLKQLKEAEQAKDTDLIKALLAEYQSLIS